ncbi:MAG: PKD domain-containing protein [Candidatus Gracilibacteria bacterium]|nr:PKD domain-containing protein [Candidatus Gracilibacteria bacterium]
MADNVAQVPTNKSPGGPVVPEAPKKNKLTLLLTFVGLFVFLFVLFLAFLVVMLLQDGGQNPLLLALGVEPSYLRELLTVLVNLVFGVLALVSFIVTLVGLFRRLTSAPAEIEKKKQSLILALVSGVLFVFLVTVWIAFFFYVSRLEVGSTGSRVILSDPIETVNLTAPVSITFTAREMEVLFQREGIVSYAWDLDADGAYDDGNGRDIQYTYEDRGNDQGTYPVSLKIILGDGREELAEKLVTIANVRPTISVDYSPKVLEVPLEVTFDASESFDPDGEIISYDWDFDGDDVVDAQGPEVRYLFTEVLDQEIQVAITDNNGEISREKIVMNFAEAQEKRAFIVVRPGLKGEAPYKVTFDASESSVGENIQAYEWDFGDQSPSGTGRLVQHIFQSGGLYTVNLQVKTESGETFVAEQEIQVDKRKRDPQALIVVSGYQIERGVLRGDAPLELTFDASQSSDPDGRIVEHRWDFDGDGIDDAFGDSAEYTFADKGTYTVRLSVVDDDDLEVIENLEVQVTIPDISLDLDVSTFSGPVPLEITFDASASRAQDGRIISYTWDFGDDTPQVIGSARQTHIFTAVGEYTVKVTVLTDKNLRSSQETLIVAREIELQADYVFNPDVLEAGKKVFFDASQSQGQISRYYWDFGDGKISRVVKPEQVFENPGQYKVLLEVYDRKNRVSRKEIQVEVRSAE